MKFPELQFKPKRQNGRYKEGFAGVEMKRDSKIEIFRAQKKQKEFTNISICVCY